jgi:hypothetical protein
MFAAPGLEVLRRLPGQLLHFIGLQCSFAFANQGPGIRQAFHEKCRRSVRFEFLCCDLDRDVNALDRLAEYVAQICT